MTDSVAAPAEPLSLAQPDAVTIEGVDMQFDGLVVLRDIQLQIPGGSAVAVVGPNGSGKTTLLNILSGIYRPAAGKVIIGGRDVTGYRPHRIARLGVGRTFQHNEMPKELPVLRVVMLGRHTKMKAGVFSYTFGIPYFAKEERRNSEAARAALRLVGLENLARRQVSDLPYGLAKRIDLARALAAEPQVLLLDEPAAGLNDKEREDLLDLLRRVKQERQLTLVVVEHDMSFIASLCERVVVLVSGSKVYDGDSASMHEDAAVVEALLGTTVPASSGPAS
jgi:branched-chain amino acid transport system ATP-binding protein